MAKRTSLINYKGALREVISVNSPTYGDHIRAVRGTFKPVRLNDAFKESGELITIANRCAKAIKDPFEPFFRDHKDGSMWIRLVSIFRLQLGNRGNVDLSELEGFDFNKKHNLRRIFFRTVQCSFSPQNKTLDLTAKTTSRVKKFYKEKSDQYQQTLVVVFYDADYQATTLSESVIFPLVREKSHEQKANIPVPDSAITAVVALKCDFFEDGKPAGRVTRKGMAIVKVLEVGGGKI
jgi:hypothetical protein